MKGHFFKIFNKYTNKFSTSVTEVLFRFKKEAPTKIAGASIELSVPIIFFLQPISRLSAVYRTKLV